MFNVYPSKSTLCGLLAVCGLMAGVQTAEGAVARLRFDPLYGAPFNTPGNALEWFGEAVVDDGGCGLTGIVPNYTGACAGNFSFVSASLSFVKSGNALNTATTVNFVPTQFGQVGTVTRAGVAPNMWTGVTSSAFDAVQVPAVSQANYAGSPAYFSLVFVGTFAQLIWFRDDPGTPIFGSDNSVPLFERSLEYLGCYLSGPGDNRLPGGVLSFLPEVNRCGLSSNAGGSGAPLSITVVPEPEAYMMALASLGVLGVTGSIARRRRTKR